MRVTEPITLPCGVTVPNRMVKVRMNSDFQNQYAADPPEVAMAENAADKNHPDEKFPKIYSEWADGGWGIIMPGNVQVTAAHLGQSRDVAAPSLSSMTDGQRAEWKTWASTIQRSGALGVIQLCHPGRQSPRGAGARGIFRRAIAPSAIPLDFGTGWLDWFFRILAFGTPRALTLGEIEGPDGVIDDFVNAAKICHEAGFAGVELHGAHGYLIAQFLSSKTNLRTDAYGGTALARANIVTKIVRRIRAETSPAFIIGIKLNSVDMSDSGALGSEQLAASKADALAQIGAIVTAGCDFIEISGGTYENPLMAQVRAPGGSYESTQTLSKPGTIKESTWRREVFFIEFAEMVRTAFPDVVLLVTGGFRSRVGIEAALNSKAVDLVGVGRPAAVYPTLPVHVVFNTDLKDEKATFHVTRGKVPWIMDAIPIKAIGAGRDSFYFAKLIAQWANKP